jgi:hypothetical protein
MSQPISSEREQRHRQRDAGNADDVTERGA